MEWKEAGKWFLVIVGAGIVGELVVMLIQKQVTLTATAVAKETARTEVERVINAAVQQLQTQNVLPAKPPPVYVAPQKEQAYAYQM